MAKKSETSRQRRARENRARREALAARTKAASTPKAERTAAAAPERTDTGASGRSRKGRSEQKAASTTRSRAERPARLGQVPVEIHELEGGFLRKVVQVPGGMQVMMSVVLVLAMTAMYSFVHLFPPEGAPVDATATQTIWDRFGVGGALSFLGPPLIIALSALFYSLHERRRRVWIMAAILLAIMSLFMPQYLFPAGFMFYAVWRAKRVEDGGGVSLGSRLAERFGGPKRDRDVPVGDADEQLDAATDHAADDPVESRGREVDESV